MNILICSWRDITNPRGGGAERVTFEHARRWVTGGHQVTLFTSRYPRSALESCVAGIRIVRRGSEQTVHLWAHRWYRRQARLPDVIVDEIHGVPFWTPMYAQVPVVASIFEVARDIWSTMYPLPVALAGRVLESMALRSYGRLRVPFIADSRSTADDLQASGVPHDTITVIEPCIDPPISSMPAKEHVPTVLFLGRLVRMKGIADAIHALAVLRRDLPDAQLWIAGSGEDAYVAELRALAEQLGVTANVEFFGRVSEQRKHELLCRARVLIHPSQREGWGINVIEANARGTPAVGYRVPGLRDSIRDGVTGLLCDPGQPADLARAMHTLMGNPTRYAAFQANAQAWSSNFTWDTAAQRSLQVIERAKVHLWPR